MSTSRAAIFSGTPSTLCGSDLHTYEGRRQAPTPTILGHEIVGRIEAIGGDFARHDLAGQRLQPGDRVTWSIVANCGSCFFCNRELPQKCLNAVKYGHEALRPRRELLGGLAEHCLLVPGTSLARIPDQLSLEAACPASCATATIAAALEAAGEINDRTVCVLGAGLLGLTACAMASSRGAAEVICVEVNPGRRALAARFGATQAVEPEELAEGVARLTNGHGVDAALELSGSPAAFNAVWPLVRTGGTLVLVGSVFPTPPVSLPLEQVVRRHLTLRGIHNYAPRHLLTAVEFLAENLDHFPFGELVAEWHPLEDVAVALERAREPNHIRIGVRIAES